MMGRLEVVVAIPTFKRPQQLALGLPLAMEQVWAMSEDPNAQVSATLLVIDNDPDASARVIVEGMKQHRMRYVVEPTAGISAARNRAIDEAQGADLLVFIDDDERPEEGWLSHLVSTWRACHPVAVLGPVTSVFDGEVDEWIHAGRFFNRRTEMPTRTELSAAATNNLLLDLHQIDKFAVRFEPRLGLSGGEDMLFTRQLVQRGGRIVWCKEAHALDYVPQARLTRRWVLQRQWSHGNTTSVVDIMLSTKASSRVAARLRAVARGLARLFGGTLRYAFGIASGSLRHQARGLRAAFRGAGMLAGAFGFIYHEYRPRHSGAG